MSKKAIAFKEQSLDNKSIKQPAVTLRRSSMLPLIKGLPQKTLSPCPECLSIITAVEYEKDGKVFMSKECPEHGIFNDIIYSDAKIFLEIEKWHFSDGSGFDNPQIVGASKCPTECGIYKTFFIFGMHFMDNYNYDLQRIRRCAVHYSAVDGRLYPFCTYNSGYIFRNNVERQYSENKVN